MSVLDAETATALHEATIVIARIRYDHHAAQIHAGDTPDNIIDPGTMPPLARAHLRDAFLAVGRAQKKLGVYTPLGI